MRIFFRPEFLNRIDEIIIFKNLNSNELNKIVDIQIKILQDRLLLRKINVRLSDKAKDFLSLKGYDPVFGARPLKRAIQNYLLNPLSSKIISGDFKEGDTLTVDVSKRDNETLEFKKNCVN